MAVVNNILIAVVFAFSTLNLSNAINCTDATTSAIKHQSFAAGAIKHCCNLRIQKNGMKNDIAKKMNNSWVRIMNRSRNARGQISVESLEYADAFLAVPRRKLKSFSPITIYDYSTLSDDCIKNKLMNRKFNFLVKNPMNRIFILPLISHRSTAFRWKNVVDLTELVASVVFADISKHIGDDDVLSTLHFVIKSFFGSIEPKIIDEILDEMEKWAFPKESYLGDRVNEMKMVWHWRKWFMFHPDLCFQSPIKMVESQSRFTNPTQFMEFQKSSRHQNKMILRKLLNLIRSRFPLDIHHDSRRPLGRLIATEIIKYWLQVNDDCNSASAPSIHVLWISGKIEDVFPTKYCDWQRITKLVHHRNRKWIAEVVQQRIIIIRKEIDVDYESTSPTVLNRFLCMVDDIFRGLFSCEGIYLFLIVTGIRMFMLLTVY